MTIAYFRDRGPSGIVGKRWYGYVYPDGDQIFETEYLVTLDVDQLAEQIAAQYPTATLETPDFGGKLYVSYGEAS